MSLAPAEEDLSGKKRALRIEMRARREAVSEATRRAFEASLPHQLLACLGEDSDRLESTALYAAKPGEASVDPIVSVIPAGGVVCFPRVSGERRLSFHRVQNVDDLVSGAFGVREPEADAPIVLPGTLKLVLVPGLAFDRRGGRLGWGRGYYDSALLEHPDALFVGAGFANQLIDEVPTEEWDVAVDVLITEEGITRCKRSR